MDVKIKTSFVLISTLILGIVIGAVGSGLIRNYIFEKNMENFRSPQGFINHLERIIQPDSLQQVQLRERLQSQYQRFDLLGMQFRTEIDSLNHEFQNELKDILTEEQQERLSRLREKGPRPFREGKRQHPPRPPR
jgi:hypothetical protein